jgi:hypothetical protein
MEGSWYSRRFLYSSYGHRFVRLYFVLFCSLALFPLFNYEYQRLRIGPTSVELMEIYMMEQILSSLAGKAWTIERRMVSVVEVTILRHSS